MNKNNYVRLPLKNAFNVRELGGYPTIDGKMTAWHSFIRSDDMCSVDQDDIDFLIDYNVRSVVDLRSASEVLARPNLLSNNSKITYKNIPLVIDVSGDATKVRTSSPADFIKNLYLEIIKESTSAIKEIMEFFATQEDCVLFHCAVGKDRTGVISMLLLGLGDVSKFDIISNYEVTYSNLRQNPMFLTNVGDYPIEGLYSRFEYIEPVIDYVLSTFGSVEKYLLSIGIAEEVIKKVKDKVKDKVVCNL